MTFSVTFDPSVGGDGSTVTDDSNATTGLANGGHRLRFVPALAQSVAVASFIVGKALQTAADALTCTAAANTALNSPGSQATTTTSITISTGSKSITLAQTGKSFAVGQWVSITDTAAPTTRWLAGAITAFNSGTGAMTVNVAVVAGSGSGTAWAVVPTAPMQVLTPTTWAGVFLGPLN